MNAGAGAPAAERLRLFVALDLPAQVLSVLERWREENIKRVGGLRAVSAEALHATLCFLGWRSPEEVEPIGAACAAALRAADPPRLSLGEAVWLPKRRPRVLAVRLDDRSGALGRIQMALSDALSGGGWYARETRPFLAHVTAARVTGHGRIRPLELAPPPASEFEAERVTLYRSRLGRGPAHYEALRALELPTGSHAGSLDPLAVIRAFHSAQGRAYAGGDLDELRAWLADDVVWHVPGRSLIAGEHRGVEAVVAYFDTRRRLTNDTFRVTVHGLTIVGDRVVQLADGEAIRDGHELSWKTVGIFRVSGGRIAECWLVPFDLYKFDQIWA
jgi:2'-5' RNA ligase